MFIYLATDKEKLEWQKISVAEDDECWKKKYLKKSIGLFSKPAEIHRLLLAW